MDYSIVIFLFYFVDDKLVVGKFFEKKLGCESFEVIEVLQIVFDVLEKMGVLVKERGKYKWVIREDVVEVWLCCFSKGFCFVI